MPWIDWLRTELSPDGVGFWLLLDLLVGAAFWMWLHRAPVRWQSLLRIVRWIVPAWLALMVGVIAPQGMGLTHNSWENTITTGVGILLTLFVLVAAARYTVRATDPPSDGKTTLLPPQTPLVPLFAALFHGAEQFHWCFQRAAVGALLVAAPLSLENSAYWAIWIASALALPGIFAYRAGSTRLYAAVALLGTAILFFYTRNFWLCWLLHAGIMILAGSVHTRPEMTPAESR